MGSVLSSLRRNDVVSVLLVFELMVIVASRE